MLGTVIYLILRYNRSLARAQELLRRANEGLEAAVAQRTAELQRANEEIQRFAYIVSHDLRSPLVNVLGFTAELDAARKTIRAYLAGLFERHPALRDEAVRTAVEDDLPEALGFIRTSTEKMDRLINSILAAVAPGPPPAGPRACSTWTQLVDGVDRQRCSSARDDAGATIVIEAPLPDLDSDRLAVEQIFSNLVENAIKYLQPGRPGEIIVVEGRTRERPRRDRRRGQRPRHRSRRTTSGSSTCSAVPARRTSPAKASASPMCARSPTGSAGRSRSNPSLTEGSTFRRSLCRHDFIADRNRHMNAHQPVNIVMIEDDEGHARLIEKNIRRAGIPNDIRHFADGTTRARLPVQRTPTARRSTARRWCCSTSTCPT